MSITCSCGGYDGSYPEFYNEERPKAKKEHICCECGETIKPGEKYHKVTGKWEGDILTYKTCIPCHNIREDYCSGGYTFGELVEAIKECFEFDYRGNYH